jgi:hypothetical protein
VTIITSAERREAGREGRTGFISTIEGAILIQIGVGGGVRRSEHRVDLRLLLLVWVYELDLAVFVHCCLLDHSQLLLAHSLHLFWFNLEQEGRSRRGREGGPRYILINTGPILIFCSSFFSLNLLQFFNLSRC